MADNEINIQVQVVPPETVAWNLKGATFSSATPNGSPDESMVGLAINEMLPEGPEARTGLRAADIIVGIDQQEIEDIRDIDRAWSHSEMFRLRSGW